MTHQTPNQLSIDTHRRERIVTIIRWMSILFILAALLLFVRALPIGQALEGIKGWIGGLGVWGR